MSLVDRLIRPHLRDLAPYSSARDEYHGSTGIFLDANENALGSVAGANWNRYPDPYQYRLKEAISGIKAVAQEKIFIGNGSDEPIDLLIRAFCEPGQDQILICPPTYGMYKVSAAIQNIRIQKSDLTESFQLDLAAINTSWSAQTKITFLCSPNNPTGNALKESDMLDVVRNAPGIVVVDEAYIDYCPEKSLLRYIDHFQNLIVLQTFSKAWGMAGFRLGMAFGSPEMIGILNKIKAPYNISGLVQQQALSALLGFQKKNKWVEECRELRSMLAQELEEIEHVLNIFPSDANFLLVRFKEADRLYNYLIDQKIIVRNRSKEKGCENCLRITVGTQDENNRLLEALRAFD